MGFDVLRGLMVVVRMGVEGYGVGMKRGPGT